jgi:putative ABC transport system permease protein
VYLPFNLRARNFAVFVRTGADPGALTGAVRDALRSVDRSATLYNVAPMTDRVAIQVSRSRFLTWLVGVFGGLALLLVMIGIYGVIAHSVTERTREIGIRMALGAEQSAVLRMILREGALLASAGLGAGLIAALLLTQAIRTLLYGVSATDPLTLGAVCLLIAATALAASWVPARRAARVDPVHALRHE